MQNTPCLRVSNENRRRLDALKRHPRESYNEVISRLLNQSYDPDPLTEEELGAIEESIRDIREGRIHSHEQVKKELGIH